MFFLQASTPALITPIHLLTVSLTILEVEAENYWELSFSCNKPERFSSSRPTVLVQSKGAWYNLLILD
jgi:hypothetical protein